MRTVGFLVVFVAIIFGKSPGQTIQDVFDRGNEAFRAGRFQEAASEYESIVRQGFVSPEVFFNLGNAYYREGKIALAILAYERALRLEPGDPDIEHNLKLANLRIIDRIEPLPELFLVTWIRSAAALVSFSITARVVLVAWIFLFSSLTLMYGLRNPRAARLARWFAPGLLILVLVFGAMLTVQALRFAERSGAIVMSPVLTAKNSPDQESADAFVIHQGLKVRLSDQVGEWVKITLSDGKVGWIRSSDCERI